MVRFELDNPEHILRPGTTASVKLKIPPRQVDTFAKILTEDWGGALAADNAVRTLLSPPGAGTTSGVGPLLQAAGRFAMLAQGLVLSVPESAVIDTGGLRLVYREVMPGTYEGVKVELGARMVGPAGVSYYPVLRGLVAGDHVVASGSFLIDAETRLNPAAGSIYFGGSGGKSAQAGINTVRPSTPADDDAKVAAALAKLPAQDARSPRNSVSAQF